MRPPPPTSPTSTAKAVRPPSLVRRLVLAPLWVLASAVIVLFSPVLLVVAVLASPLVGRARPVRVLWLLVVYLARDSLGVLACLGLWLASGFGRRLASERMRTAHYAIVRWFLAGVYRTVVRAMGLHVVVDGSTAAERALSERRRPAIVLARHAGVGDSFLLVHRLLNCYGRRPLIVMKDALQLDPFIDIFGNRLPNRFIDPHTDDVPREIAELADQLAADEALFLFPEGGNVTAQRRQHAIERVEQDGEIRRVEHARRLKHLVSPRPRGAIAAISAAPTADVILIAHTGLPDLASLGDAWSKLPIDDPVRLRLWLVTAEQIPTGDDQRTEWLDQWWARMDGWIEAT